MTELTILFKPIRCLLGLHDWTCAASEGIEPTERQLTSGLAGFYDYATMYCKRCRHISELSKRDHERYCHE